MIKPGPTPRIQGRYFVVAEGTTLPKICVRTGSTEDLAEIQEYVRTPFGIQRIAGVFGALFAYQDASIRYYIRKSELARMQRQRRLYTRTLMVVIALLAIGAISRHFWLLASAFVGVCGLTAASSFLPTPLHVAAVWGGQVFLLKVPRSIIDAIMRATDRPLAQ